MRKVIQLKVVSPIDSDVESLIGELDGFLNELYPEESNHLDSIDDLSKANCRLIGAYTHNNLVGIGAAKILNDYGELKRFFIKPSFRGQGVAECIVAALEKWLVENNVSISYLETGIHQQPAIHFYKKLGYEPTGPFGSYKLDPLSVFMKKNIRLDFDGKSYGDREVYLVAFSSKLNERSSEYSELSSKMTSLAKKQKGFLGVSSTRNDAGTGFTVSYWRDLESISIWKNNSHHLEAQKLGKIRFYEKYRVSIAVMNESFYMK